MIKKIVFEDKLIALLIDHSDIEDGTHPITNVRWPLQMLMMKRNTGHVFAKHTHILVSRTTAYLQEAIVVMKGLLRVTVCDRDGIDVGVYNISAGQCILLVDGGCKIEIMEDTEFFEFKNGPYLEDDKVLL